jgi:hypothetical protein
MCIFFTGGKFASLYRSSGKKTAGTKNSASLISVLCSWHKTKGHICQYRQSFMEWLNLEGIGDKKKKKNSASSTNATGQSSLSESFRDLA